MAAGIGMMLDSPKRIEAIMYAIIEDSGTQIKVSQGDVIKVALREMPADVATIYFDKVLAVSDPQKEGSARIGAPYVAGAKVTGEVLAQAKEDRKMSWRYRRRKNVLVRRGHRQDYLSVKITAIEG